MSVVGELSVIITADAKGVKKAITASNSALKKGSVQLRKSINEWGKWGAAAAAAAGVAGAALVKSNLSSIREIKNLAAAADTQIDVFQRQAFAAEQVGISTEKYGDILKDVNDRVGDFTTSGAGPMVDFFEQIAPKVGVTIDQFQRLSGADALQLYVSSIEKANVSQKDMIFFMEAMAGDSARLLPLLQDNGKAMKAQAQAAKELGIGLSEIDVAQAEAAQKALDRVAGVTEGQLQKATVALAPLIEKIADEYLKVTKAAGGTEKIVIRGVKKIARVMAVWADGVHAIKILFQGLKVAATAFNAVVTSAFAGLMKFTSDIGNGFLDLINKIQEGALAVAKALRLPSEHVQALENSIKAINSFKADPSTFEDFAQAQRDAVGIAVDEMHNMMMQPLPSQSVEKFLTDVEKASEEAKKVIKKNLKLDKLSASVAQGYFDEFKSASLISANRFKDDIEGIKLNTQAFDSFFQVAWDGSAKTQLKIREALEGGGLNMSQIDRFFGLIETRSKQSGNVLNDAMKTSLDGNAIQVFFDMLHNKKEDFGNIMSDMFGGSEMQTDQIATMFDSMVAQSIEKGAIIKANLIGQGISEEQAEAFIAPWLAKTAEAAEQIATNLTGGATADGSEDSETGEQKIRPFTTDELLEALGSETEILAAQHQLEWDMLQQAQARELFGITEFEQKKTEMEQRQAQERIKAAEDEKRRKRQVLDSSINAMTTALAAGGEKSKKIGKKIAIARAIVMGGEAAVGAWNSGMATGGPWAPLVAAAYTAASIARTSSMISSIKGGTKPSSGGRAMPSTSTPSSSPSNSGENSGQAASPRNIQISMQGSGLFSSDQVRELIGQINEQVGDGVSLAAGA